MPRTVVAIAVLLCCTLASARPKDDALVNYGLKTGFSSTIYEVEQFMVAGVPINDYMAKSEISSFHTVFARFNIKRHYLQTELSYNISKYTINFATSQWDSSSSPYESSSIGTKFIGLELPLYYGYHIVQEGPYAMSFFIGPKAKFILADHSHHTFNNFPYSTITESIHPINFSLMAGLGVNIARVFFDFSFEYGLHDISKGFTTIDLEGYTSTQEMAFARRKNVLSFSIGFMF